MDVTQMVFCSNAIKMLKKKIGWLKRHKNEHERYKSKTGQLNNVFRQKVHEKYVMIFIG